MSDLIAACRSEAAAFRTAAAVWFASYEAHQLRDGAFRAMFPSLSGSPRPPRHHYPRRFYPFLEDAATEREMHRP